MLDIQKNMSAKTALTEAYIENFSHDGRGIARINGKTTFIQGALPKELVTFRYLRKKRDFDEGQVESILKGSASRKIPLCNHYNICGGCSLQHLDDHEQIYAKQAFLLELLQRIGKCMPTIVLPPLTGQSWHYRRKARLSVKHLTKKDETLVGFREKNNPRFIAKIEKCLIMHSKIDVSALRNLVAKLKSPTAIAQIEVAVGDEDAALIFRNLNSLCMEDQQKLKEFGLRYNFRILLQPKGPDSIYRIYPENSSNTNDLNLANEGSELLYYKIEEENLKLFFHPIDFIQVNLDLNQLMVKQALQLLALQPDDFVLDLFCGLGNFSLPIAKYCKQVVGIEGNLAMTHRARSNAALNGLTNVEFFCFDLFNTNLENFANYSLNLFSKLLLDPPRSGAYEIVKQINNFANLKRLVYVSCNPATLARDANILVNDYGFELNAVGVIDLFPHTTHVETIALFQAPRIVSPSLPHSC